jgi:7-cyano-7-deazaguanine synthase
MKKAVVILSGGMDSGVLLAKLRSDGEIKDIHTLNFQYGSNHNAREGRLAEMLSEKYHCSSHLTVPLDFIRDHFKSSLLAGAGAVPEGHYAAESMKSTVVPFRNGIMLSLAVGYAESVGTDAVFIGNHAGDHFIYPDCRPAFIKFMDATAASGTFLAVRIKSPFCDMTKRDIGLAGNAIGFDFSLTYSCYKGGEKHCGKCGSCTERKEALAGFDTTEYEQ